MSGHNLTPLANRQDFHYLKYSTNFIILATKTFIQKKKKKSESLRVHIVYGADMLNTGAYHAKL